ncbi:MAG: hypothetical protein DHS20C16_30480 [Phycisphaerae bacterium]|nr:MAG: hypothetical protein DHS20C16_30480 [Phycisphaerae bacterium]
MNLNQQSEIQTAKGPPPKTLFVPFAIAIPLTCIWLAIASARTPIERTTDANNIANEVSGLRLNPNTATWSDLALLPRIGQVTARRIVEYRDEFRTSDDTPAFKNASDLEQVRGIGPITVAKIAPHLKFDAP